MANRNEVEIVGNLVSVSLENYTVPEFVDKKNKDYILFGSDNNYPNYLLELYNRHAEHHAIISGKANFIYGKGLSYEADVLTSNEKITLEYFLNKANRFESYNEVARKSILDLEIFNGVALQIIWGRGGIKIAEVYHLPFGKIRVSKDGKKYYYCDEWIKEDGTVNNSPEKSDSFKEYEPFNENIRVGTQILYFKVKTPSAQKYGETYPLPDYTGCIADVETDIEITNWHFNNLKNGFSASSILSFFNGEMGDEAKKKLAKLLKSNHTGTNNTGKFLLNFVAKGGQKAEVTTLQASDLDKQFELLSARIQQKVFTGHKVTSPILFGIKTEGQLGGRSELIQAYEHFQNTYISNRQEIFLNIIKGIANVNGVDSSKLIVLTTEPIGIDILDPNISKYLSNDEVRKKLGYETIQTTASSSEVIDAINSLSPLVANKVLESMTPDEIRSLVGLIPKGADTIPNADTKSTTDAPTQLEVNDHLKNLSGKQTQGIMRIARKYNKGEYSIQQATLLLKNGFGLTDEDVNTFLGVDTTEDNKFSAMLAAYSKEDLAIKLFTETAIQSNDEDEIVSEEFVTHNFAANPYEDNLTKTRQGILDAITGDPFIKNKTLAKLLDVDVKIIDEQIKYLADKGFLDTTDGSYTPTKKTLDKDIPEIKTQVYTVYKYVTRSDVPSATTSRKFCKELLSLSNGGKEWTRDAVNAITNSLGEDAWAYRGGFYTNPDTKETTPYCRHIWKAITKTKKVK